MAAPGQRKVLICVDGSEQADYAFKWYLAHNRQDNDYVYGATVPEYHLEGITVGKLADADSLTQQVRVKLDEAEKLCANFTAELRRKGMKGQCDIYTGNKAGEGLVHAAEILKAECIIMGTRGLSKLKSFFHGGSVSQYMVQHSPVPVHVIPFKKEEQQEML